MFVKEIFYIYIYIYNYNHSALIFKPILLWLIACYFYIDLLLFFPLLTVNHIVMKIYVELGAVLEFYNIYIYIYIFIYLLSKKNWQTWKWILVNVTAKNIYALTLHMNNQQTVKWLKSQTPNTWHCPNLLKLISLYKSLLKVETSKKHVGDKSKINQ